MRTVLSTIIGKDIVTLAHEGERFMMLLNGKEKARASRAKLDELVELFVCIEKLEDVNPLEALASVSRPYDLDLGY